MVQISIEFDDKDVVYFPGQTITGKVLISSNTRVATKVIKVECYGCAKVHWSETHYTHDRSDRRTEFYSGREEYYKNIRSVFGDESSESKSVIEPGNHSFDFAFSIPYNAPTSFESRNGSVRHKCKAILDLPLLNEKTTKLFTVGAISDLNSNFFAKAPIDVSNSKMLGMLCCKSGPISFVIKSNRSGYVPGESIMLSGECSNKSSSYVYGLKAKITQKLSYMAKHHGHSVDRKICSIQRDGIRAGEEDAFSGVPILIPPVPPSDLPGCSIIDIKYFLEIELSPSGVSSKLTSIMPLFIGTVPFSDTFKSFVPAKSPQKSSDTNPSAPAAEDVGKPSEVTVPSAPLLPYFPALQTYPDLPPPSYSECVFGVKEKDDSDDEAYTPKYVTYKMES